MLTNKITEHVVLSKGTIEDILKVHTSNEIDVSLSSIITTGNMDEYLCASRFFRDVINYNHKKYSGKHIHNDYYSFKFFNLIESNLFSETPYKRNDAIYTLGKVGAIKSIPKITTALNQFLHLDAEYSNALKFELNWLNELLSSISKCNTSSFKKYLVRRSIL